MTSEEMRPDSADRPNPSPPLPTASTEEEIREFWDTHDSSPYWDQMEDVTDSPPPELAIGPGREGSKARRRPPEERLDNLVLVIPRRMIDALEQLATERVTSVDALLESWIAERLAQERSPDSRHQSEVESGQHAAAGRS